MSTDRELLEMAAKAAGVDVSWCDQLDVGLMDPHIIQHPTPHFKMSKYPHDIWNPLYDDGDALRLAVKLGLDIMRTERDVEAIATLPPYAKINSGTVVAPFSVELIGSDPDSATRRAIVRAAAEIGRNMP